MSSSSDPVNVFTFFHKDLNAPIRCSNASDALIAPLLLTTKNADIKLFNAFLTIIHNPTFNSKEVTFRSSGEVLAHIANVRGEDVGNLVEVKANSSTLHKYPPRIPQIVVEAAINAIRDEMIGIASDTYLRGGGSRSASEDMYAVPNRTLRMETLLNCSLVHSSWLLPARHAAGVFLRAQSTKASLMRYIQNSCFGQWTRNLHLVIGASSPRPDLIDSLFARTPSVSVLTLEFSERIPDEKMAFTISKSISQRLSCIEELTIAVPALLRGLLYTINHVILEKFLDFPDGVPSLKAVRLAGFEVKLAVEPPYGLVFHLPTVAPNLQLIQVQLAPVPDEDDLDENFITSDAPVKGPVVALSWTGDGTGMHFAPSRLYYRLKVDSKARTESPSQGIGDIFPLFKYLRLDICEDRHLDVGEQPLELTTFLRLFTSLNTLELCLPFANGNSCNAILSSIASLPRAVENLRLRIEYSTIGPPSTKYEECFPRLDRLLSTALNHLNTGTANLRTVTINTYIELNGEETRWMGKKFELLYFPQSTHWCALEGITCNVFAEFLSEGSIRVQVPAV